MCLYPKIIKNKKYTETKKNGGIIPPVKDERVLYVPVGCGKCIECRKQVSRSWQIRMSEEIKEHKNGKFVTLTFSEKSLREIRKEAIKKIEEINPKFRKNKILENEIATIATRRFLERWRKKYKKSVRHWLITELGHEGTERIHMHGIIFTDEKDDIKNIWKYGNVWIGKYVNQRTINYTIKYITKIDIDHKGYIPKVLCSKGIGKNYMNGQNWKKNKYKEKEETQETYITHNGYRMALPIYYRNKIYTEEEREMLWIKKIEKNIRYVMKEKVVDDEDYYKVLKHYREKNKRLGYGDDSKEWSIDGYKEQRKKLYKKSDL